MNNKNIKAIFKRLLPLEIFLMIVPILLLILFEIDIFHGRFIFELDLSFSQETILTIFMGYELILSTVSAMMISYVLAIIINQFSKK
ncbi:hypothetical protein LQZ19_02900 [Treponema primitia]|uniref:hypothetical protein n=1 Tax=Treponema primitia TaxID=88058 RepID=UPI003980BA67